MTHDAALQVLRDLIHRIDTQDNRCTAKPFIHLLQYRRRRCVPHCGGDGGWWGPEDDWEIARVKAATEEEALKILKERFPHYEFGELERYDAIEWWETVNVFLTQDGYERHVALNHHNFPGEHRDYLEHAYRNPELKEVLDAIREIIR